MSTQYSTVTTFFVATDFSAPLDLATARHQAGLRILPHVPGLKQPAFFRPDYFVQHIAWAPYQLRPPTSTELAQWYQNPRTAHAVIPGEASGGVDEYGQPLTLEILDIDDAQTAAHFLRREEVKDILEKILQERTHKYKAHLAWRTVTDGLPPIAKKIAMRSVLKDGKKTDHTLIELLAQSNLYCVVSPSPGYTLTQGDWLHVPIISHDERARLIQAAQSYDERPRTQHAARPTPQRDSPKRDREKAMSIFFRGEEKSTPKPKTPVVDHQRSTTGVLSLSPSNRVASYLRDPARMPAIQSALGYRSDLQDGDAVCCPCDLHKDEDSHPSGVWRVPKGETKDYGVFCFAAGKFYTLNELHHFQASGNILPLHRTIDDNGITREHRMMFLLWGLRQLVAAGQMIVPKLHYPALHPSAPADEHTLWRIAQDAHNYRCALTPGIEVKHTRMPLTYDFLRDWGREIRDWSDTRIRTAHNALIAKGLLRMAGVFIQGCMQTILWHLGKGKDRVLRALRAEATTTLRSMKAIAQEVTAAALALPALIAGETRCVHGNDLWIACPLCEPVEIDDYGGMGCAPG